MRRFLPGLFLALVLAAPFASAQPSKLAPDGDEAQVNSYTAGSQRRPDVAAHEEGFVVVWQSDGSNGGDNDGQSIQARRLDAAGDPLGDEIQVNGYTASDQDEPAIATWPDGRFVVIWRQNDFMTLTPGLTARLFAADGTPETDEFFVEVGTSSLNRADVEVAPDGDSFVVVWPHWPGIYRGIRGRRFLSDGSPSGPSFEIGPHTALSFQNDPQIAARPDGDFVVVWESSTSDGDDSSYTSIQMRWLDSGGSPVGSPMQVNTYTTNFQEEPSIAVRDDGSFVVAWDTYDGGPDDGYGVVARRFDSAGAAVGDDFQVNSYTPGYQDATAIGALPDGGFVVVWDGNVGPGDTSEYGVAMRRLDASGTPVGDELVVNALTVDNQEHPTVAVSPTGDVLVAWDSDDSAGDDNSDRSIQARFLVAEADVGVTLTDGVTAATPGEPLIYTLVASNGGPDAATGVELEALVPLGLDCDWASLADGGATGNTGSGSGDVVETLVLPMAGSVTYTLDCDVAPNATGTLTLTASIEALQVDANAANDSAFDTDDLEPSTDLEITLSADPPAVDPGDPVLLQATVLNLGPSTSTGSEVTAQLPAGLVFAVSPDCVDSGGGTFTCQVPALDPGEELPGEVGAFVDGSVPIGTHLTVDATVAADEPDPVAANDSDSTTVTVGAAVVFADGFESGDTSRWSAQVP